MMLILAACESQEVQNESENTSVSLQIETSISDKTASRSDEGKTNFDEGDAIGLFEFDGETATQWTLSSSVWTPETEVYWPSKTRTYNFYGFYPYDAQSTPTNVVMPDLTEQDGTFADEFDFIVATTNCSYSDTSDGTISLTFSHVYSMLTLCLTNATGTSLTLNSLTASLTGIMTQQYYDFEEATVATEEDETAVDQISFTLDETIADEEESSIVFLTNAIRSEEISSTLNISVEYAYDETTSYKAEADAEVTSLEAGTHYVLNLSITKNGLSISGFEIEAWESGTIDDVVLIEEEN